MENNKIVKLGVDTQVHFLAILNGYFAMCQQEAKECAVDLDFESHDILIGTLGHAAELMVKTVSNELTGMDVEIIESWEGDVEDFDGVIQS